MLATIFGSESTPLSTRTSIDDSPGGTTQHPEVHGDGMGFVSGVDTYKEPYGKGARGVAAAIDAITGRTIWAYRSPKSGPFTMIGSNERAVAGAYANGTYYQALPTPDTLIAFDGKTGKIRWRLQTSGPVKMSPVIARGKLYVGDTVGVFYTVDARTGQLLKAEAFSAPFSTSPPIIVGDTLIVANGTTVRAFPI